MEYQNCHRQKPGGTKKQKPSKNTMTIEHDPDEVQK